MAGNRLAQILEREYKTQGLIGGLGSAMGKRVREKMDIRNALFGGSGFTGIVGRKVFGKGYSATSGSNKIESNESAQLSEQTEKIDSIANTSRIVAKNTLALPSMARDMYLVKQNIIKLVKLNGGNAQTKAGEWFSRQKARESAFGSMGASKTPTKANSQQSPSSSGGFMGFLGGMIDMVGPGKLLAVVSGIAAVGVALVGFKGAIEMISKMMTSIYNWVARTEIGQAMGMKETEGSSGGSSGSGSGNGERGWKNPLDVNWSKVGGKAVDVASNVGGVGADIAGIWAGKKIGNIGPKFIPAKVDLMDGRDWHKIENKLVTERLSSKEISNGRMGRVIERLRVFSVEAAKKGWAPRIRTKLTAKLGSWVAIKCATLFASLAAAPFSAGLSLLISIVSWAMLMKDLYDIYDAICGPGGIWDELHEEDKSSTTPTQKTTTEIDSNNATISKLKTQMETTTNSYEKESLQKKISYYEDKNKKLAAQTPPTPASTGGSDDFNFAEYKRSVGGAESRGDYNTTFNNPNAKINGKPLTENTIAEVAAWQDKNRASNRHAAGKYQFIDVAAAAKDAGLSMGDMFSAINQEKMMDAFTKINAATLKKGGFEASKENLSLAHSVGAGRAVELLNLQKNGKGGLNVATDVLNWKKGENRFDTNPHLNKSVDQVIADAGKRVGSPNYSPSGSDTGNMLAQLQQNPFAGFAEMLSSNFGDMLNNYHEKTKDGGNFDSGTLQTYNDEFLKKLLGVQTFQPNKA